MSESKYSLNTSIKYLKGVGPKKMQAFNNSSIYSVHDLLNYYPRRYLDRSTVKLIKDRKLKFEPKVLGEHPKTKNEVSIKRGRFGPYVTDGKKNASLKGYVVDEVTLDQAVQLIDEKS